MSRKRYKGNIHHTLNDVTGSIFLFSLNCQRQHEDSTAISQYCFIKEHTLKVLVTQDKMDGCT